MRMSRESKINSYLNIFLPQFLFCHSQKRMEKKLKCTNIITVLHFSFMNYLFIFLSISTFVYTMINTSYIEMCLTLIVPAHGTAFYTYLFTLLHLTISGCMICSHWIKNTFVHYSLCRCKISAVSKGCDKKFTA